MSRAWLGAGQRAGPGALGVGLVLTLVAGLAAASTAGGCAPAPVSLPLAGVPWLDGETGTYAWLEGGLETGTGTFSQHRVEDGWELRNTTTMGFFEHAGSVVVDPQTMMPLRSEVRVSGVPTSYEVAAVYGEGRAELTARTAQGDRTLSVKLPKGHHLDNDQLLATIRCLPLREGFKLPVNLVNTVGGISLPVPVAVEAIEELQLQVAGLDGSTFAAYRVSLLGGQQRAWYTVAAPHVMLRYDNGQRVCELREYAPGR
ncbi:MAG: hypothetical protein Q8P31_02295 [Bacillota bacterium]|nr:hypothetical protein [Bacillota bacterium]